MFYLRGVHKRRHRSRWKDQWKLTELLKSVWNRQRWNRFAKMFLKVLVLFKIKSCKKITWYRKPHDWHGLVIIQTLEFHMKSSHYHAVIITKFTFFLPLDNTQKQLTLFPSPSKVFKTILIELSIIKTFFTVNFKAFINYPAKWFKLTCCLQYKPKRHLTRRLYLVFLLLTSRAPALID